MHGYVIETVVMGGHNTIDLCKGLVDAFIYFSSSVVAVEFVTYVSQVWLLGLQMSRLTLQYNL